MKPLPPDREYHYEAGNCYNGPVPAEFRKQMNHTGISYLTWYLEQGTVELRTDGQTLHAKSGDWVWMDPLTTRSHHFSEDAALVSIRFRLNWRGLNFIPPRQAPRIYNPPDDCELLRCAKAWSHFQSHTTCGPGSPAAIHCLRSVRFSEWLYHWHLTREAMGSTAPVPIDPRVSEVMSFIGREPGIGSIDYGRLSATVGLSKAQINRIFKASTGLTPRQWKEQHSMRAAEDWLEGGRLSIKEIASKLNFYDASHFIKWFRKLSGCTPKTWRAQHRVI